MTTQREVGICCYLIHRLLGPWCPLVESLRSHAINMINEKFSSFALQIATSHRRTEFAYDVSCIIGTYLNTCVKALATASVLDPGG